VPREMTNNPRNLRELSHVGHWQLVLGLKAGADMEQLQSAKTNHHSGEDGLSRGRLFSAGSGTVAGTTAFEDTASVHQQVRCHVERAVSTCPKKAPPQALLLSHSS